MDMDDITRINFKDLFDIRDNKLWPKKKIRIGAIEIGPGAGFNKGISFGDINLFEHIGKDFRVRKLRDLLILTGIYDRD